MTRVDVKICGVRTSDALRAAVDAGADWVGFNFVPTSRRCVSADDAADLLAAVQLGATRAVGVFGDQAAATVMRVARKLGLAAVQLHGSETPAFCAAVGGPFEVWKALAYDVDAGPFVDVVDRLVIDGRVAGSGEAWAWEPRTLAVPWFVAGGLDPANVADALRRSGASGADVASGVERGGVADPVLIAEFVATVRRQGAA